MVLLLQACVRDPGTAPDLKVDTSPECAATAPVIQSVTVENAGLTPVEGTERALANVLASAEEAVDQDLDRISGAVWWDTLVDGEVDVNREPDLASEPRLVEDNPCRVRYATYGAGIVIGTSRGWLPNTLYEVAVVVFDAHGAASEVALGSGWSPNEDGTDGGT